MMQTQFYFECESCIHLFRYRPGYESFGEGAPGSCVCGYPLRNNCQHFDRKIHCLNGYVYGEKRGCGFDCETCYAEFERGLQ